MGWRMKMREDRGKTSLRKDNIEEGKYDDWNSMI
jgi:hypothetical protein